MSSSLKMQSHLSYTAGNGDLGKDWSNDTRRLSQSSNLTMGRCIVDESNKVPSGS